MWQTFNTCVDLSQDGGHILHDVDPVNLKARLQSNAEKAIRCLENQLVVFKLLMVAIRPLGALRSYISAQLYS